MVTVNDYSCPYRADMTLLDALREAAVDINGPVLITRNGSFVPKDRYPDVLLTDGDEILAMRVVSGG